MIRRISLMSDAGDQPNRCGMNRLVLVMMGRSDRCC